MFDQPAHKLHIKDLNKCIKTSEEFWKVEFKVGEMLNITKCISFKYVWLQGFIEEIAGREKEVIIVNDHTGTVKVTHCNAVLEGHSWLVKGKYCSVVGSLIKESGMPEVAAMKLTDLSKNPVFASMWTYEVEELANLHTEQAMPKLPGS